MRDRAERVINLAGLRLPLVDTVIITVTAFVLLTDHYFDGVRAADATLAQSIDRAFLYGVVPLAVLLLLRERPFDYGLRLGSWRVGVALATFPFVFTHLGKPPRETYSALLGGTLFGWMAWRTGSVLYAFLLHLYILTLIVVAASASP